ncbi:DUF7342 family protein [Halorussus amylolyticus]|uniref:DUF7342 family protein n=1 Tax=Halorussus amylolyticus TaxID=1126242 RepID=UPI00104C1D00|nr:hypothetical protein [Halorussus amylolyticus]
MSTKDPRWPENTDAAARVRHVALTRTEPRNAGWIAEEADVSRDTAVKYLERMADRGDLKVVETNEGRSYKPDSLTQFLREVRELAEEHSLDELTRELNAIGEEIDAWKDAYEVESLAELRQSIGREDLTGDERRERLEIIEEWEYNVEMRESIQLAIRLKSSLTTLGAESLGDGLSTKLPQEG